MAVGRHMRAQPFEPVFQIGALRHEDMRGIGRFLGTADKQQLECIFADFVLDAFGHGIEPHPLPVA